MKLLSVILTLHSFVAFNHAVLLIQPSRSPVLHDLTEGPTSPVAFTCKAPEQSAAEAELKWFDIEDVQITATSGRTFVRDAGDQLILRLTTPQEDDSGPYTCKGIVNGVEEEASIELEVYRGINVTSPKIQYTVKGTDARIWCRMTQTTIQKVVSWYRGDNWDPILENNKYFVGYSSEAGNEGDYLMIRNITLEDGAEPYICNIDMFNFAKSVKHIITVVVTVPPRFSGPITMQPPTPKEGDRLQLICEATGIPRPTYMFKKDGQDLLEDPNTDGHYVIQSVRRSDEGRYVCEASNQGGADSTEVIVDVRIPPEIMDHPNIEKEAGTEVRFPCIATGDPAPNMFWRRKGEPVDIMINPGTSVPIYVEEATDAPEQDEETKLYRRTLTLVIPVLKPEHAHEYLCKAENEVEMVEKTFSIIVLYKPNFSDQNQHEFWGWPGGKTNLTCIASGNPLPVITWYKDDRDLTAETGYTITHNVETHKAISNLVPVVDTNNVGTMFGEYRCEARNAYGVENQKLTYKQAVVPGEATVIVEGSYPTVMHLRITPPTNNGGQPVIRYLVKHGKEGIPEDQMESAVVNRVGDEESTNKILENLLPNTRYLIKVYAVNNVGQGAEKIFLEPTAEIRRPFAVQVVSPRDGSSANSYWLQWNVPMSGGADIDQYHVKYAVVEELKTDTEPWTAVRVSPTEKSVSVLGQSTTQVELTELTKNTYYQAKITATNRKGASDETTFIFKTGTGVESSTDNAEQGDAEEESDLDSQPVYDPNPASPDDKMKVKGETVGAAEGAGGPALGAGGIVGLMVVILLVLAVAVDAAFCKTKQCGLLWLISQKIGQKEEGSAAGGKSPEDGDEAAAKLLGKEKEDSLRTENEVAKETEAAEEAEPERQEKKELEPEEKEEIKSDDKTVEEPVPAKTPVETTNAPVETKGSPTGDVQIQPSTNEEKQTANA